jgi:hypothetical protein
VADPIEDMVQFMLAFTGDASAVDDEPYAHEAEDTLLVGELLRSTP